MIKELIEKQEFASNELKIFCEEQLKITPDCFYTHYLLGRHYQSITDYERSIDHYKLSILQDKFRLGTWQGLHNTLVANFSQKQGVEEFSKFINKNIHEKKQLDEIEENMLLIRIVEKKWVDNFIVDCKGRFSPTKSYRKPKDEDPRFDLHENRPQQALKVEDVLLPGFHCAKMELQIGGLYRILCFSHVTEATVTDFFKRYDIGKFQDDENREYSAIVIHNSKEFIKRVVGLNPQLEFGEVLYLPHGVVERANGILCPFVKDEEYSPEFEFRLATQHAKASHLDEAVFLGMGELNNIVKVLEPSELFDFIKEHFEL